MSAIYRIRVKNHLEAHWTHWFDEMSLINLGNGEVELVGPVADQENLHRLLEKIRDLNLTLIKVERLEDLSGKPA